MNFLINIDDKKINIVNNSGEIISSIYFIPSYLIWRFFLEVSRDNPIILSKENETFYQNINWLMTQSYYFPHEYCQKTEDKLIWMSEHCFNLEDKLERDKTPRLIIEKLNNDFAIYFENPFREQNNLPNNGALISFAPAGNGYLTKNTITHLTLQDDLIKVFKYTLYNQIIGENNLLTRKK